MDFVAVPQRAVKEACELLVAPDSSSCGSMAAGSPRASADCDFSRGSGEAGTSREHRLEAATTAVVAAERVGGAHVASAFLSWRGTAQLACPRVRQSEGELTAAGVGECEFLACETSSSTSTEATATDTSSTSGTIAETGQYNELEGTDEEGDEEESEEEGEDLDTDDSNDSEEDADWREEREAERPTLKRGHAKGVTAATPALGQHTSTPPLMASLTMESQCSTDGMPSAVVALSRTSSPARFDADVCDLSPTEDIISAHEGAKQQQHPYRWAKRKESAEASLPFIFTELDSFSEWPFFPPVVAAPGEQEGGKVSPVVFSFCSDDRPGSALLPITPVGCPSRAYTTTPPERVASAGKAASGAHRVSSVPRIDAVLFHNAKVRWPRDDTVAWSEFSEVWPLDVSQHESVVDQGSSYRLDGAFPSFGAESFAVPPGGPALDSANRRGKSRGVDANGVGRFAVSSNEASSSEGVVRKTNSGRFRRSESSPLQFHGGGGGGVGGSARGSLVRATMSASPVTNVRVLHGAFDSSDVSLDSRILEKEAYLTRGSQVGTATGSKGVLRPWSASSGNSPGTFVGSEGANNGMATLGSSGGSSFGHRGDWPGGHLRYSDNLFADFLRARPAGPVRPSLSLTGSLCSGQGQGGSGQVLSQQTLIGGWKLLNFPEQADTLFTNVEQVRYKTPGAEGKRKKKRNKKKDKKRRKSLPVSQGPADNADDARGGERTDLRNLPPVKANYIDGGATDRCGATPPCQGGAIGARTVAVVKAPSKEGALITYQGNFEDSDASRTASAADLRNPLPAHSSLNPGRHGTPGAVTPPGSSQRPTTLPVSSFINHFMPPVKSVAGGGAAATTTMAPLFESPSRTASFERPPLLILNSPRKPPMVKAPNSPEENKRISQLPRRAAERIERFKEPPVVSSAATVRRVTVRPGKVGQKMSGGVRGAEGGNSPRSRLLFTTRTCRSPSAASLRSSNGFSSARKAVDGERPPRYVARRQQQLPPL